MSRGDETIEDEFSDIEEEVLELCKLIGAFSLKLTPIIDLAREAEAWRSETPIDLIIICPVCDKQHLDIGEFRTRVHRKHLCENTPEGKKTGCGHLWAPHTYATRGVTVEEMTDRDNLKDAAIRALHDVYDAHLAYEWLKSSEAKDDLERALRVRDAVLAKLQAMSEG